MSLQGPYTVFAPTNAALAALGQTTLEACQSGQLSDVISYLFFIENDENVSPQLYPSKLPRPFAKVSHRQS